MKLYTMLLIILLGSALLWGQTAIPPTAGNGSPGSPYEISSLGNLYWIAQSQARWNSHYLQTADIMAIETVTWDGGWTPIGNEDHHFGGSYNGNHHSIEYLIIERQESYQGLFGFIGQSGLVRNLHLSNAFITGFAFTAPLAAVNYGQIISCSAEADVSPTFGASGHYFAGLVAYNLGSISRSSSTGSISNPAGNRIGGLVGDNEGTILDSYSRSDVFGSNFIGGLAGISYGEIWRSYAAGEVSGTFLTESIGGLAGHYTGANNANFWDIQSTGQSYSQGATGLPSHLMRDPTAYLDAGWDFVDESINGTEDIWAWDGSANGGYPFHHIGQSELGAPAWIQISRLENQINLTWQPVAQASSYRVYSAPSPSGPFTLDSSGSFSGSSWQAPATQPIRFYRVTAVD